MNFLNILLLFVAISTSVIAKPDIDITVESGDTYPNYSASRQESLLYDWMLHILERTNEANIQTLFADPTKAAMFLETVREMRNRISDIPFIIRSVEFTDGSGISPSQYLGYAGEDDPKDPRNVNFTIKFIQMLALYNELKKTFNFPRYQPELRGLKAFLENVTMHEFLHGYDMHKEPLENVRRQSRYIVDGVMTKPGVIEQAVRIFEELEPRGFTIGSAVLDGYRGTNVDQKKGFPKLGNLMKATEMIKSFMITYPEKFAPGGEFYLLRLADFEVKELYTARPEAFTSLRGEQIYKQLLDSSAGLLNPFLDHYLMWDAKTSYNGEEFDGMLGVMFWGQVRPLIIIENLIEMNKNLNGLVNISPSELKSLKENYEAWVSEWAMYMENKKVIDQATKLTVSKALFKSNGYLNDPALGVQDRYKKEMNKANELLNSFSAEGAKKAMLNPSLQEQPLGSPISTALEEAELAYAACVSIILRDMSSLSQAENYCLHHLNDVTFMDSDRIIQAFRASLQFENTNSCKAYL